MAQITLYCAETPGLKLGPNSEIVFEDGYADVDTIEFPDWADWAYHSGTPFVRVLEDGETARGEHVCDQCGKTFATARAVNGHLLSHRPKRAR